jgi:dienelactone hydrolase
MPSPVHPPSAPDAVALLWHGRGPHESRVLATLAAALAHRDVQAVVPDWDSGAPDGGAAALRASMAVASSVAERAGVPWVLVGWSLGGTAALSVAPSSPGGAAAVVGLAADTEERSPLTGRRPLAGLGRPGERVPPLHMLQGTADTVVRPERAEDFRRRCAAAGIPCRLSLVDTDHAGVIGTEYDPARRICVPSDRPTARRGLVAAVDLIAGAVARARGVDAPG